MLRFVSPPSDHHDSVRLECLMALANVYRELKEWKPGGSSAVYVGQQGRKFLGLHKQLVEETSGWAQPWVMYPIVYQFLHVVEDQFWCSDNPSHSWTYLDEGQIGLCVKLCEQSNARCLHRSVLVKHRL